MPRKQTLTEAIGNPMGAAEMPGASVVEQRHGSWERQTKKNPVSFRRRGFE